ncbi:MAG: hypothetical protein ABI670_10910 [Chloroflexota bacterium]
MPRSLSTPAILALLAALAALLVAWFVPLPRLVLSEEERAGARMPENRSVVEASRIEFENAEAAYKSYVTKNDVGAALAGLEQAAKTSQANSDDPALHFAVRDAAAPVFNYLDALQTYAKAGEKYLGDLRHYDDELMAWTRSLGTESEALRPDTWPIVEYLKLYPPPTGQSADYPGISAADVANTTQTLQANVAGLSPDSGGNNPGADILKDVDAVRAAGRSVEYSQGLNAGYHTILANYDKKVQSVVTATNGNTLSSGRVAFATGLNLLMGAVTLLGLAALFFSQRSGKRGQAT